MRRIPGLDGARGVAALMIVVVHTVNLTAPSVVGGVQILAEAVVFFFALSGFLIYLPYALAIEVGGPMPDLRRFASARVRRIFPAWIVVFLIADLALGAVYLTNVMEVFRPRSDVGTGRFTDPLRLLEHLSLVANLMPSQLQTGINPSWSLTTELTFYLALPVLALAASSLRRRSNGLAVAIAPGTALVLLGVAGTLWAEHLIAIQPELNVATGRFGPNWTSVLSRSLVVQGAAFGAGMIVAAIFVRMRAGGLTGWTPRRVQAAALGLLAGGLVATQLCIDRAHQLDAVAAAVASGGFLLSVTASTARGRTSRWARVWDFGPLAFVGTISLSMYLWHYPVLVLVTRLGVIGPDSLPGGLISIYPGFDDDAVPRVNHLFPRRETVHLTLEAASGHAGSRDT